MKTSLAIAAILLLVIAGAFTVVQMDLVDAEALRFLPAIAAIVIAAGLIYPSIIKRLQERGSQKHNLKKGEK